MITLPNSRRVSQMKAKCNMDEVTEGHCLQEENDEGKGQTGHCSVSGSTYIRLGLSGIPDEWGGIRLLLRQESVRRIIRQAIGDVAGGGVGRQEI